jgi:hypothetical protein
MQRCAAAHHGSGAKRSGDPARKQRCKNILGSSNMTRHLPAPGNRTHDNRATIKHFHSLTNCAIHKSIAMVNVAKLSISSLGQGSCCVSGVPAADKQNVCVTGPRNSHGPGGRGPSEVPPSHPSLSSLQPPPPSFPSSSPPSPSLPSPDAVDIRR